MARRLRLNSRMGLLADDTPVVDKLTSAQFHGPGGYAQLGYNEKNNQRQLLRLWADYLEKKPPLHVDPATVLTDNPHGIEPITQTNGQRCAGSASEPDPTSVTL